MKIFIDTIQLKLFDGLTNMFLHIFEDLEEVK